MECDEQRLGLMCKPFVFFLPEVKAFLHSVHLSVRKASGVKHDLALHRHYVVLPFGQLALQVLDLSVQMNAVVVDAALAPTAAFLDTNNTTLF